MAKRFTSTEKWDKEWFQDLSPRLKCFWQYMTDRCDHAGVWEANYRLAGFCIGEEVAEGDLLAFGDRVEVLGNNKVYLRGFVEFQYGKLSTTSKPHASVIKLLEKHKLPVILKETETLAKPLPKGSASIKDKDKDKDKEKESRVAGRLPASWVPNDSHRAYCLKEGIDFDAAVAEFKDWATNTPRKYLDWGLTFHKALKDWLPEKLPANKKVNYGPNGLKKEIIRP